MIPSPVPTSWRRKSENASTVCPVMAGKGLTVVKPPRWQTAQPTLSKSCRPRRISAVSWSRGGGPRKRMKSVKPSMSFPVSSGSLTESHAASFERSPFGAFSTGKRRFVIPISFR